MQQTSDDRRGVFSNMDVTVTMKGEEWFALLARIIGRDLSAKGARTYNTAAGRMQEQILAASRESLKPTQTFEQQRKAILADRCASYWLKTEVRALDLRDALDMVNDAEALLKVAKARLGEIERSAA